MSDDAIESGNDWEYSVVRTGGRREFFIQKGDPQTRIFVTEDTKGTFRDGLFLEEFYNEDMDSEHRSKSTRAPLSRADYKNILRYLLRALNKSNRGRLYAEAGANSVGKFAATYGTFFDDEDGYTYFYVTKEKLEELERAL